MPFDAVPERKARRPQANLTDLGVNQVRALKTPGRHRVSKGLYLNISPGGARSWVHPYMQRGKAHELWLGSADTLTLAKARDAVIDARRLVAAGKCPIAERRIVAPVPHPFSEGRVAVLRQAGQRNLQREVQAIVARRDGHSHRAADRRVRRGGDHHQPGT